MAPLVESRCHHPVVSTMLTYLFVIWNFRARLCDKIGRVAQRVPSKFR